MNYSLIVVLSVIGLLAIPATAISVSAEVVDDVVGSWLLLAIAVLHAAIVVIWLIAPADPYRRAAAGIAAISLAVIVSIWLSFVYHKHSVETEVHEILRQLEQQID